MGIPEKTVISGDNILQLIPQREPIVMIDTFYGIDNEVSRSALTVKHDNIFCENGTLTECGIIEHIAQSAAARVGYIFSRRGERPPIGFIGSVNNLKIYSLPAIGDQLQTSVSVIQEVFDITLISASVSVGNTKIAEGKMKIFISSEL